MTPKSYESGVCAYKNLSLAEKTNTGMKRNIDSGTCGTGRFQKIGGWLSARKSGFWASNREVPQWARRGAGFIIVFVRNNWTCAWLIRATGMMSGLWLHWVRALGSLANLARLPGFARDCDFESKPMATRVRVRNTRLYTIVTVNGVDVYFYRLTGGIDGVGMARKA